MQSLTGQLQAIFGLVVFLSIAWGLSERRAMPDWRLVSVGLGLQLVIALIMFKIPAIQGVLAVLNQGVNAIAAATEAGTRFVFGYLGGDPANLGLVDRSGCQDLAREYLDELRGVSGEAARIAEKSRATSFGSD